MLIIEFLNNYWKFMKSVNSHSEIGWKLINGNEISRENLLYYKSCKVMG